MKIKPIFQKQAKEFIASLHRHHGVPLGAVFCISVEHEGRVVGVATVGRPIARHFQDGYTLEVTRLCTDGTKNACSKLYSCARRIAREMGYKRIITYILEEEPGTSLKASGWELKGIAGGGSWSSKSRPRVDKHPLGKKQLWESILL